MTELQPETDRLQGIKNEVIAREVEALVLAHNPEVIRVAAAVGRRLPLIGVDKAGEGLEFRRTLREQIIEQLGRVGITDSL